MAILNRRGLTKCFECGKAKGVPILYGMPSPEAFEAAERGELVIGGCLIDQGDSLWQCPVCGHRWGTRGPV